MAARATVLLIVFIQCFVSLADEHSHSYEDNEEVVLWMNTIGPYANRQETYNYFSLHFCQGKKEGISHYHESMAEDLQGKLASSLSFLFRT
jgi:transmembrane 9 superfamily member 3